MSTQSAQDALIEDVAKFVHDPLGHARYVFPWGEEGTVLEKEEIREWQVEVLDAIGEHLRNPDTRFDPCLIAVATGHGVGKSALVGMIGKWAQDTFEGCRIVLTANTEDQLRGKTWPEFCKWSRMALTADWFDIGASTICLDSKESEETWEARLTTWSKNNTEAFAGLHNKGKRIVLVMDEGSAIDDKVFEVAEGALTDEDTEIIWIVFGNPTRATGRFRECFRKYRKRWKTWQIDSRTVRGTNKKLLKQWEETYGEDSDFFKVRCRGLFPNLSAKQFISEADVDAAYGKHLRKEHYEWAPVILSCDPAWEGDDELVIAKRQGLAFQILRTMPKNDNDIDVANILGRLEDEHNAQAVFVDLGYGTGIVSAGKAMGRSWTLVPFGGASSDPGCLNKRAEMWNAAKKWLKDGGAIPADEVLRDDLMGPETVARTDGKLAIEPKSSMKARGLLSPNRADALVLTFAGPVYMPNEPERARVANAKPFHPFED